MVALYEDLMIHSLQVVTPLLQSLHDGQELQIISVVVLLGTWAFSEVEADWFENSETIILVENTGDGEAAYIGLQRNQFSWFETLEDGCISKGSF